MSYEQSFLYSLCLTLLIEVPIVFILIRYLYRKIETNNIVLTGIIASTLTLPYFWFIFPMYVSDRSLYIILGESLIVLIEAVIYNRLLNLKFTHALFISIVANVASILGGLLLL
jgi:hypothetical protein